ncbi:DinB family protein [Nocardioides sp. YIM 152588]|uniref:DinB family protein n=1 Tax=Nocardioides sp. YIM 152588 TaxID=3158259 RepID=UPI0032E4FCBB
MADPTDPKATLHRYLRSCREALLWKLDGLDERQVRLPHTATGNNLLGIVKHCVHVEIGYFGVVFDRDWPTPEELVLDEIAAGDPQADWYATEDEPSDLVLDLAARAAAFADATIDELPLDAPGKVPWWPEGQDEVVLHQVLVHVITDLARHAGQADVIRERIDGSVGMLPGRTNIPGETDWASYRAKLTRIANRFG